jgi:dihydroorotate dehydrogenase electron transfer subunit
MSAVLGELAPLLEPLMPRPPRPAPSWDVCEILEHVPVSGRYRRLRLRAPVIAATARPGQFVMLAQVEGSGQMVLPRPMAIHRRHAGAVIDIVYGVVGQGTAELATATVGQALRVIGPLGTPFDIPEPKSGVLALGRGIGVCAWMGLVEEQASGSHPMLPVLSAATRREIVGLTDCIDLGVRPWVVTDADGSSSIGELERRLMDWGGEQRPSAVVVCGSRRLAALAWRLARAWDVPAQLSVEATMACGLGYCHGCATPASGTDGPLVCTDGPVFALNRWVESA